MRKKLISVLIVGIEFKVESERDLIQDRLYIEFNIGKWPVIKLQVAWKAALIAFIVGICSSVAGQILWKEISDSKGRLEIDGAETSSQVDSAFMESVATDFSIADAKTCEARTDAV